MKYKILMEHMYKITNEMHSCIYGIHEESEVFGGKYLCYGKLYDSWDQIEFTEEEVLGRKGIESRINPKRPKNLFEMDFRCSEVDYEVVTYISTYICDYLAYFLENNRDGDLQILFLGCVLNLYYSAGLFDRCGILNLEGVVDLFVNEKTKKYALILEKLFLQEIHDTFYWLCENKMFTDGVVNEYLEVYLLDHNNDLLNKIVAKMNPNFLLASGFVKEYIKRWNDFSEYETEKHTLNELQRICPEYQFANLLLSISSIKSFLDSKGQENEFVKYKELLDEEIFKVSLGIKKPSSLEVSYQDGQIITAHPESFSRFGLGLPYVNYISKNEFYSSLLENGKFTLTTEIMGKKLSIFYPYSIHEEKEQIIASALSTAVELEQTKESELKAKEDRNTIIRQFSHTYMNMRATSLYNIAMELLKNPDKQYRNYGRKLLYEYSVKQNLTKDIEMLKLRFEDNEEELYKIIVNSILSKNEDGVGINELIDEAIIRCMVTLVHDGSATAKKLRKRFVGYDWISIRNSFESDILLSDSCETQKWFCKNMFPIEVKIDEKWKEIVFEKDSYASLLFVNILSELLTNIFRYADTSRCVKLEFTQCEKGIMIVSSKNYVRKDHSFSEGSGFGLQAEAEIFKILNGVNCKEIDPISIQNDNEEFEVNFQISKKLFEKD